MKNTQKSLSIPIVISFSMYKRLKILSAVICLSIFIGFMPINSATEDVSVELLTLKPVLQSRNYSNQSEISVKSEKNPSEPWWNNSWHYRIEYNISKLIGHNGCDYSNSPVSIIINFSSFSNGNDDIDENSIRVVKKDGTILPSETFLWGNITDPSTTGFDECRVRFLIDQNDLDTKSNVSVTYYIYYDTTAYPKEKASYSGRMGYDPRFAEYFVDGGITCGTHAIFSVVDWNNDTDKDIVTGCNDGNIIYFENDGDNTFTYIGLVQNNTGPIDIGAISSVSVVDYGVNGSVAGDNDLDMIIGEHNGGIYYYECNDDSTLDDNSDSTFILIEQLKFTNNTNIDAGTNIGVRAVDFSIPTDDYLDLIVGDYSTGKVHYYENNGSGKFIDKGFLKSSGTDISAGGFSLPYIIDYNNDGDLDLILGCHNGTVYYYENNNDNTLATGVALKDENGNINVGYAACPVVLDWNKDGDNDLIIGNGYGRIYYYERNDTSTDYIFKGQIQSTPAFLEVPNYAKTCAADWSFPKDGLLDLWIGDANGDVSIYENDGDGTFTYRKKYDVTSSHIAPFATDYNGDGDIDLIVGLSDGTVYYYERTDTGGFTGVGYLQTSPPTKNIDVGNNAVPCLADWDGDGDKDLIIGADDGKVYYYDRTDGSEYYKLKGALQASGVDIDIGSYSAPTVCNWSFSGGLPDLLVGGWSGSWDVPDVIHYYERNDTDGTLTDMGNVKDGDADIKIGDTTPMASPFAVDWNNDGCCDLIVGDHDGFVTYYKNKGDINNVTDLSVPLNVQLVGQEESVSTYTFEFYEGWNYITLPLNNTSYKRAEDLANAIENCTAIAKWNTSSSSFEVHYKGTDAHNFTIDDSVGYLIYVNSTSGLTITGEPISSITMKLKAGWNSIGWFNSSSTDAESLSKNITNCTSIACWNNSLGRFIIHPKDTGISNFEIKKGDGCLVYLLSDEEWVNQ
ncbi:MAG: hypothetical protein CO114_02150 [Euryarchaeota archaeon CG_4_9_14_3_um_filter_38_12]|nr:MAG: hypothetical protein CO114_02150 [Euryarchaeota archaeon CG_4_9_14_3_um_filter_38_12]